VSAYSLTCELLVGLPMEKVFAVFEDPYNLAKITPPSLSFEVVSPNGVRMERGAEISYRIRWLGLPLHWKTIITAYHPPHMFVDEQAKGPYVLWRHHHTFAPTETGTKVQDNVEYILPFGALGRAAHSIVVARQLKQIFLYRQQALTRLFNGKTTRTQDPVIRRAHW
jgi:uncharacterized protein